MTTVRTQLGNTVEEARRHRFEPTPINQATNVQQAIANTTPQPTQPQYPASGSPIVILPTWQEIGINTSAGAVVVDLPSIAAWVAANPSGLPLRIFDVTGNAFAHNVTFVLNGSDTFLQGASPSIKTNFGGIELRPVIGASNQWNIVAMG